MIRLENIKSAIGKGAIVSTHRQQWNERREYTNPDWPSIVLNSVTTTGSVMEAWRCALGTHRELGKVFRFLLVLNVLTLLCEFVQLNRSSEHDTKTNQARKYRVKTFQGLPTAGENHIFFVETSCVLHNASAVRLTPRAACALEAAATLHPTRVVYLAHTCPVPSEALARGEGAPAYALAALDRPNVRLWPVNFRALLAGSPLEAPLAGGAALWRSRWPLIHGADYLRFLLLWRFGGTYLDQDMLLIRSLGNMSNFGCAESSNEMSAGAFNFARDDVGRLVSKACIDEIKHLDLNQWANNSDWALARALKSICGVQKYDSVESNCNGFLLLPSRLFYPIPNSKWIEFFREENNEEVMKLVNDSKGIHVWNDLSRGATVFTSSRQPYAQIARKVCPDVVAAVGETM